MILIAHRGNITGPNPETENTLKQINLAIDAGYKCEIDLWVVDGSLFLGHDEPAKKIMLKQIKRISRFLYVHAKNTEAVEYLSKHDFNYFMHDKDPYTLTRSGEIWCYPSKQPIVFGVNVMPEWNGLTKEDLKKCYGVCSDFIQHYK